MRIEGMDGYGTMYMINSRDPELLGKWLIETLLTVKPDHVAPMRFTVWPDFSIAVAGNGVADWVADTRIIGMIEGVVTPEDMLKGMADQIEKAKDLHGR